MILSVTYYWEFIYLLYLFFKRRPIGQEVVDHIGSILSSREGISQPGTELPTSSIRFSYLSIIIQQCRVISDQNLVHLNYLLRLVPIAVDDKEMQQHVLLRCSVEVSLGCFWDDLAAKRLWSTTKMNYLCTFTCRLVQQDKFARMDVTDKFSSSGTFLGHLMMVLVTFN